MNRETTVQQLSEVQSEKNRTETMVFNTIDCLNIAYAQWDAELRFLYGNRRWLTAFQHYLHEGYFDHLDQTMAEALNAVRQDTSGCFLHQAKWHKEKRDQVLVVHKR